LTTDTTDLWWSYNWNNSSEILSSAANILNFGHHFLEVFWAEGCCNGGNSARFSVNGGDWKVLDVANLNSLEPVPVPAALWLFGSVLVGLMGMHRKKLS
jgi:hypothetical protein